ncbi:MAG: carboxypeptidase [Bdellovibrionales bacterium]|nr:carboxypeptidase [Bdellovibrionales bacterium]
MEPFGGQVNIFFRFLVLSVVFHGATVTRAAVSLELDHSRAAVRQYDEVRSFLGELAKAHPGNARIITLGESDSGEPIVGLEVGSGRINQVVVATHHGNEYGSTEVGLAFARDIAARPIPGYKVHVIPVLNVSGYNRKMRREAAQGRSYDPNRNYPGPCGTEGPFTLKSTRALARFISEKNIVTSATLHTFSPAVVYPWGLSSHDLKTGYEGIFKGLVEEATRESNYPTGNSTELIYPADGTYEDYAFHTHGIWSVLFELGQSHNPSTQNIETMVRVNVPGIRRMLESAPIERASKHAFSGKCDRSLVSLDRHDE